MVLDVLNVCVHSFLVENEDSYDEGKGDADCEAEDINYGKEAAAAKVTQGGFDVVAEHMGVLS